MTDLQTSLLVIGGVIVVGVISYNKWQEHKTRKSVERAFSSDHDDVLMNADTDDGARPLHDDERQEPELYQMPERRPQTPTASAEPTEPYLPQDPVIDPSAGKSVREAIQNFARDDAPLAPSAASFDVPPPAEPVAPVRPQRDLPVDDLIDCAIPIALESSVRGDKILPPIQNLRYVGNKPVHFIGRTEDGEWEAIAHGGVYTALLAGAQLANRSNALNELEYSELVMRLREFTDSLNAEPEIPDMMDVMKTAQALHQFIMDHDVQLGVNVRSNGAPWNISTLLAALTRQGFDRRTDGHLVMQDGEGEVLFSLSTNATQADETTDRLTLLLDVPRVGPARDGYGALIACARSLAMRLGGTVVDDSDQLLTDAALADIGEQVSAFYSAMESADVAAGSNRATRLFS